MASVLRTHENRETEEQPDSRTAVRTGGDEATAPVFVRRESTEPGADGLMRLLMLAAAHQTARHSAYCMPVPGGPVLGPRASGATATPRSALGASPAPLRDCAMGGSRSKLVLLGVTLAVGIGALAAGMVLLGGHYTIAPRSVRHAALRPGLAALPSGGKLAVESEPPGALVFVNGEPTGLRTPTRFSPMPGGQPLDIRVELAGFQSRHRRLTLEPSVPLTLSFQLPPAHGLVRFEGAPPGADLYVDGVLVAAGAGEPAKIRVGRHQIRVEAARALLFTSEVQVVAGEQTFRVRSAPRGR